MKIGDLFNKWNLTGLKLKTPFLEMDLTLSDKDKDAAWDLYIELLTRITTQSLPDEDGIEKTALASVYKIFELTRNTLKNHGRDCVKFSRISIIILNQVIRPFTAKWHKKSEDNAFSSKDECISFRNDLKQLQEKLINYTGLLAELADVEDLIGIQESL